MSSKSEKDDKMEDEIEFSWGKKKGRGAGSKDVQFYESFRFDGVEYSLYDSVYLFKEGETEPYIGKILKIWERAQMDRKVKVLWFFRPSEISTYLQGNEDVLENELFLGTGVGTGLTNVNHLDSNRWFTPSPWEDRMKEAYDQERLVLLQNLDPTYIESDVKDIILRGFQESCEAKILPRTATSNPYCGQAFAIFKTREVAQKVIRKLEQDSLLLPNGRPLVGTIGIINLPGKQPQYFGHIVIPKCKQQKQREAAKRDAVSTSHAAQTNTIEFEMALEWRLLQDRSDLIWKSLYQKQGEEMRKLKATLKSK